jgi:hypothetical protein
MPSYYISQGRGRGKGQDRKPYRAPSLGTLRVTPPYRAEHPRKKSHGAWHQHIEDAISEARTMGVGARVVSSERVLLVRFDNAAKFVEARREAKEPFEEE